MAQFDMSRCVCVSISAFFRPSILHHVCPISLQSLSIYLHHQRVTIVAAPGRLLYVVCYRFFDSRDYQVDSGGSGGDFR